MHASPVLLYPSQITDRPNAVNKHRIVFLERAQILDGEQFLRTEFTDLIVEHYIN